MKTWISGYPDAAGKGAQTLLFGSENSVENNRLEFLDIKVGLNYPTGIVRVELQNDAQRKVVIGINNVATPSPKPISKKEKKKNEKSVY